jgi:small-conductance mechanosensitive channel
MAVPDVVSSTLDQFSSSIVDALPALLSGLVFLVVAYIFIRIVRTILRAALERAYPVEQQLIVEFTVIVATVFLWFGAGLVFLNVLGLGEIAASLGTATGFIALGVSYALSEMVEDTVAGVYLLRDPDFNPGDRVNASGSTGTVTAIGLRKSRFELDNGDTLVLANRSVESKWTKLAETEAATTDGA